MVRSRRLLESTISRLASTAAAAAESGVQDLKETLDSIERGSLKGDYSTYARLVKQCKNAAEAKRIHALVAKDQLDKDPFLARKMVEMYASCNSLDEARRLFEQMGTRNVITWTFMITANAKAGYYRDSIRFFRQMQLQGVRPDKVTLVSILQTCNCPADFSWAKSIHRWVEESGFDGDLVLGNALITTYGKCSSFEDSLLVFQSMVKRDVISWNAMILVYLLHGKSRESMLLFQWMQLDGTKPDRITFLNILNSSSSTTIELDKVKSVHCRAADCGLDRDMVVSTALLNIYSRCGSLEDAESVFESMIRRDFICINAMIAVYAKFGHCGKSLALFKELASSSPWLLDKVCFLNVLRALSSSSSSPDGLLAEGKMVHELITKSRLETDVAVATALVNMYGSCGSLEDARQVFDAMADRDLVAWNAMITAYAKHEEYVHVIRLFNKMVDHVPGAVTLSTVLHACTCLEDLQLGSRVHERMVRDHGGDVDVFVDDPVVGNALVNMYGRCGDMESALDVFSRMQLRDACTWNGVVMALMECGRFGEAIQMSKLMHLEGVIMDGISFTTFLNACATSKRFTADGELIHRLILESGLEGDGILKTTLLSMYAKFGNLEEAGKVFKELEEVEKDVVAWNAMCSAYANHGCPSMVMEHFHRMQLQGVKPDQISFVNMLTVCQAQPGSTLQRLHGYARECGLDSDVLVGTALLSMYGCHKQVPEAEAAFASVRHKDSITWNAMMAVYNENNEHKKALDVYWDMDVRADRLTFILALNACANLSAISQGRVIHKQLAAEGYDQGEPGNYGTLTALVNMYSKSGQLKEARTIFERMPGGGDVVTWNTMVSGYAQAGNATTSLLLFWKMQQEGVRPDLISFVTILGACSHSGLLEQGCTQFSSLLHDHNLEPVKEHYACMVDLFGRAGRLDDAEKLVGKYAVDQKENPLVWTALLGACSIHNDTKRGRKVAQRVIEIEPGKASWYVTLSNLQRAF